MTSELAAFVERMKQEGWICPNPMEWNQVWEMLPNRRRVGAGWEPPLPLILGGWWASTDGQKQERFETHLKWASEHGAEQSVLEFLEGLKAKDWYKG